MSLMYTKKYSIFQNFISRWLIIFIQVFFQYYQILHIINIYLLSSGIFSFRRTIKIEFFLYLSIQNILYMQMIKFQTSSRF
ncbi:hypothetical protein pb186bvf_015695 [Paramecium bursaria]